MDTLTSMKVFARVAQAGSFAGAARELGLSRAAVTKHIGALEARLGARLINRTTRSLSLTEAGAAYRERCTQILAEIDEAELAVSQLSSEPRGVLRITAPTAFGTFHLAPAVAAYMRKYPEVDVVLMLNDRRLDLADEGIDLAVRISRHVDQSLIARKLGRARYVVCGSPAYLAQRGRPAHPRDLAAHNCLRYTYRDPQDVWEFDRDGERVDQRVAGTLEANVGNALRYAAMHGAGLAMLPTYMVGRDLMEGTLEAVLTDWELPGIDILAIYLHRKHLSAKVRTFVDFLHARFQPRPYWDDWMPDAMKEDAG